MKIAKITFLMTAHNAESFINLSIESVLNQNEADIRLIIRNNGSTDHTSEICKRYARKDSRILYLENKTNWVTDEGATYFDRDWWPDFNSEFVAIIDHDDILDPDFSSVMYREGKVHHAQIVGCGRAYFKSNQKDKKFPYKIVGDCLPPPLCINQMKDISASFRYLYTPIFRALWGKLYQTDFYEKYYQEVRQIPGEIALSSDTYIVLGYMERCQSFVSVDRALYWYRMQPDSGFFHTVDFSRIREGEGLYEKGVQFVKAVGIDNKFNLEFLQNVYAGHLLDLVYVIFHNSKMTVCEKLDYLEKILAQRRLGEFCETRFHDFFPKIVPYILKALPDLSSADPHLWKYYIVRMIDAMNRGKGDLLAYPLLLSSIYDEKNPWLFGMALLNDYTDQMNEGESYLSRIPVKEKFRRARDMRSARSLMENRIPHDKVRALEEKLAAAVDCENFELASDQLESLTRLYSESEFAVYYRIYLSELIGQHHFAVKMAYMGRALHSGNQAIEELSDYVLSGERREK